MTREGILVVEDNPGVRRLLCEILGDEGWDVREAADPVEAIRMLSRKGWMPAALLLDLHLPGMSGTEVIHWVRTQPRLAELPILIVTGLDGVPDRFTLGRNVGLVQKPFKKADLAARVREFAAH